MNEERGLGRAIHVLLIDDCADEHRHWIEFLRNQGVRVSVAMQGNQGFHKALIQQPDIVLLEAVMPGMDGLAVCRLLKAEVQTQHIPVIFISHAQTDEARVQGLEAGAVDYLPNTISAREVLARVGIHYRLAAERSLMAPLVTVNDALPLWKQLWPDVAENIRALPVRAALHYVQPRLATSLRLAEVAQAVGLGERQLSRHFQAHLGHSVFEAIRRLRMEQAQHLLRYTILEVAEVGVEVGYPHAGNFATAFREHVGVTPSTYREKRIWNQEVALDVSPSMSPLQIAE